MDGNTLEQVWDGSHDENIHLGYNKNHLIHFREELQTFGNPSNLRNEVENPRFI
jgi:hypothetical protein